MARNRGVRLPAPAADAAVVAALALLMDRGSTCGDHWGVPRPLGEEATPAGAENEDAWW